jgi:hypothetical protein
VDEPDPLYPLLLRLLMQKLVEIRAIRSGFPARTELTVFGKFGGVNIRHSLVTR